MQRCASADSAYSFYTGIRVPTAPNTPPVCPCECASALPLHIPCGPSISQPANYRCYKYHSTVPLYVSDVDNCLHANVDSPWTNPHGYCPQPAHIPSVTHITAAASETIPFIHTYIMDARSSPIEIFYNSRQPGRRHQTAPADHPDSDI